MMPILQHYQRLLGIDYLVGTTPTIRDGVIVGMTDEDAPRDSFKLTGVTSILNDLGISFDQAIAIGDSPADRRRAGACGGGRCHQPRWRLCRTLRR
jgi:phosphoserine phosphatase